MDSPYSSFQLPGPRHIRLLQVFPNRHGLSRICCRFLVVDLDDLPCPFRAISYVWGDSALRDEAWFDDGTGLTITASAGAVLRSIITSATDKYFWIDALCINQEDLDEKSLQVQLMYDIFFSAEQTIAWTGETADDSEIALDFLITLLNAIQELLRREVPITMTSLTSMESCQWPSPNWTALRHLLERPCFQRIWIIQEMVASSSTRLVCGDCSINWKALARAIAIILGSGLRRLLADLRDGQDIVSPVGAEGLVSMYATRYLVQDVRKPPTLSWLLLGTSSLGATNPRDRIFALANISSDKGDVAFKPNYRKSVEDVYLDSTISILTKKAGEIGPLYAAGIGYSRNLERLPSWVPDWTANASRPIIGSLAESTASLGFKGFKACGTDLDTSSITFDETKLFIKINTRLIGRICTIADPAPRPTLEFGTIRRNELGASQYTWLLKLLQLLSFQPLYSPGELAFPDALCRTLVADFDKTAGRPAPSFMITNFLDYFSVQFFFAKENNEAEETSLPPLVLEKVQVISTLVNRYMVDDQGLPLPAATLRAELGGPPYIPKDFVFSAGIFSTAMSSSLGERRVIMTRDGYIGLAPSLVQEDDLLCLIGGSRVPFVLRKRIDGGYYLVGEAYVHGLMYGVGMSKGSSDEIHIY